MRKILLMLAMMLCCVVARGQYTNKEMLFWETDNDILNELKNNKKYYCDFWYKNYNGELDGIGRLSMKDTIITNDTITIKFNTSKETGIDENCFLFGKLFSIKYNKNNGTNDTIIHRYSFQSKVD